MSVASEKDKERMKEIFNKYDDLKEDDLKSQINLVKKQLEMLEERKTTHEGVKLARIFYGYEPSEEALKNIREFYNDKKKDEDK